MSLAVGTRLGAYEILAAIGAGGMGEVYRARDTRLDRSVAIKVLPAALAEDAEFRERFDREARAISQLDHPNICTLYDVGEAPSPESQTPIRFLVLQYLEGESLAARLERGPVPIAESLAVAAQIADALDRAHRAGIVHRDLKPANVFLTRTSGSTHSPQAKLLDFGLAKTTPIVASAVDSMPPTVPHVTAHGMIVGTFPYMAPEQVEGKETDARTDLFAFGCVLFEMLTGRRAFDGKTPASVFSAILRDTPTPVSTECSTCSPALDRAVARCLEKDPENRWQTARDLRAELQWIAQSGSSNRTATAAPSTRDRRRGAALKVSALAAVALAVVTLPVAVRHWRETSAGTQAVWFQIRPPDGYAIARGRNARIIDVAPDGQSVVYQANAADGTRRLWLHRFDAPSPQAVAGAEGGSNPFWSPDGRYIGFFRNEKLVKIDANGGTAQEICDVVNGAGGTWNQHGEIVFSAGRPRRLYRVRAAGGAPETVTIGDAAWQPRDLQWPQFLADGRHVVFHVPDAGADSGMYVLDLGAAQPPRLVHRGDTLTLVTAEHVVFARGTTLVAQKLNARDLEMDGDPVVIANDVRGTDPTYAASVAGALVFLPSGIGATSQLKWLNRHGQSTGTVAEPRDYQAISLSPDERLVAAEITDARTDQTDVFLIDPARTVTSRLTVTHGPEEMPVWSADGARIAFASHRGGRVGSRVGIFVIPREGGAEREKVIASDAGHIFDWSPDGRYILFTTSEGTPGETLWAQSMTGDAKPLRVMQRPNINDVRFSPDGNWIVYSSRESGRQEVYVTDFPNASVKSQISNDGGTEPSWPSRANEIIYLAADGKLTSVPIKTGQTVEPGSPAPLFDVRVNRVQRRHQYAVSSDGQRFLVAALVSDVSQPVMTVILNWPALLKK